MFKYFILSFVVAASSLLVLLQPASASNPHDAHAEITSLESELKEDGNYNYQFETTNGIVAQESGAGGHYATGSSQYYSPEGQLIQLTYTADENGFHPHGDHLPTPPPIPEEILKALEYIRQHPEENGDGEEEEEHQHHHHHHQQQQQQQQHHQHQQGPPSNQYLSPQHYHKL